MAFLCFARLRIDIAFFSLESFQPASLTDPGAPLLVRLLTLLNLT